ncbi:MAG: hypothetical protein A3F84_04680 [Candidatus Handelsmanbacteria bacterium RIFCSPLOWO2_12_FULL_64_10]|uniref:CRISPR-associated protein Cas6 C-terminal domain-containing protein n=1 Tax=Handelsmanbacteria sp. (strain RIFCSPLOWO2_12_FULL_64_10) TaxID=1817868 RepID=A0A1F6CQE3_HANXR|nr:MAG: hypothetical protein A3F84_04680 [Candidatus Handelsmanbacteria bacterium RIFCSPLOWO2_12_FULL_64_10]
MNGDDFKPLRWASFEVTLRAEGHLRLPPYKGSVLRGAFGATFKRLVCVMPHRNCDICLLRQQCVYAVDFETPVQTAGGKKTYAPHPFVLEPPPEVRTDYVPEETLTFGLTLIGRAIEHLPYFIYTFEEMGQAGIGRGRGACRIDEVRHMGADGARTAIYDGAAKQLVTSWSAASGADLDGEGDASSVTLDFLTPTRLKVRNDLLIDLDFAILIRALLRRVSALAEHHCGGKADLDYQGLVSRAKAVRTARRDLRWHDWERYSARQKTTMKLGGFVGRITFEGDIGEFLPLLRAGEQLHVGKGTAFGLGTYKISGSDT